MKRSFFYSVASFFAFFCVLFIPFPFHLTQVQYPVTQFIFGKLISFISANLFDISLKNTRTFSDSVSMYILVLLLFLLAVLVSLVVVRIPKWISYRDKVFAFFRELFIYYLALQLLKYGLDKIFKNQFYLPEPNILYTPAGRLDKDILYWSSMGTSHLYSVFMGASEIVAAVFLLFKRTRLIGLLMSLAILLNVTAINFGFDIGVKLYSLFLLFIIIYLLAPHARKLYRFLTQQPVVGESLILRRKGTFLLSFLKWLVVGLIFLESLYPFLKTRSFNGDLVKHPYMHGAYEVQQMIVGVDTMNASSSLVKRLFIHKDGYMIFQGQQDDMLDYKLSYDKKMAAYFLTDYALKNISLVLSYNEPDSLLTVSYTRNATLTKIEAKAIDWKKLPALKKGFRWTVDGY